MTHTIPDPMSLVPPIGEIPPDERMFRVNWVSNLARSPEGAPMLSANFAAKQGRRVRLIDIREQEELFGPLGYIPGSDWIPESSVKSLGLRLDPDDAIILLSRDGKRSDIVAIELEKSGLRFVASLMGGLSAWKNLGYATTRDRSVLERRDVLHRVVVHPLKADEILSKAHVEEHLGDALSVRWIKLSALLLHGRLACVDGRDDSTVLGTPGGDAGELILALSCVEKMQNLRLSQAEIDELFRRRLDAMGAFYLHTDVHAANHAIAAMRADPRFEQAIAGISETFGWKKFWVKPPNEVQEPLIVYATTPANMGCGHLRRSLQFAQDYGTRPELVKAVLSAFHRERWAGSPDTDMVVLAGDHRESAVLNVRVSGEVYPFTNIPLVSPSAFGKQMFINHPQVASYLRRQLSIFMAQQSDLLPNLNADELHGRMEVLAGTQLASTLSALAKGLPVYNVNFDGKGQAQVTAVGLVEG